MRNVTNKSRVVRDIPHHQKLNKSPVIKLKVSHQSPILLWSEEEFFRSFYNTRLTRKDLGLKLGVCYKTIKRYINFFRNFTIIGEEMFPQKSKDGKKLNLRQIYCIYILYYLKNPKKNNLSRKEVIKFLNINKEKLELNYFETLKRKYYAH